MTNKQKKPSIEVVDIESLVHDDKNFNRGTEEGGKLIARSFKEHGAGRSVLLDKNNRLVAGNKAAEGAREAGIRHVIVVETEGDEMVAVRRKDVDLDTAEGRKMALLDNLTQQVSLAWDTDAIQSVQAEIPEFDTADFGFDILGSEVDIDGFFEDIENHTDKTKGFKVTVNVPPEYNDKQNEIVSIITEAVKGYKGVKIK